MGLGMNFGIYRGSGLRVRVLAFILPSHHHIFISSEVWAVATF